MKKKTAVLICVSVLAAVLIFPKIYAAAEQRSRTFLEEAAGRLLCIENPEIIMDGGSVSLKGTITKEKLMEKLSENGELPFEIKLASYLVPNKINVEVRLRKS